MKNKRTETWIIDGEERTVELGDPEICDLVREARTTRGLSLRELARRSGVSAGQLSRIEAGDVERPSVDTLEAIAGALARPAGPLLFLANHIDREEMEGRTSEVIGRLDAISSEADALLVDHEDENTAEALWRLADHTLPPIGLADDSWREIRRDIEVIAEAWVALTPERRQLVLAFVSDQEVLSTLDRLPSHRGRYRFAVEPEDLKEVDDGQA